MLHHRSPQQDAALSRTRWSHPEHIHACLHVRVGILDKIWAARTETGLGEIGDLPGAQGIGVTIAVTTLQIQGQHKANEGQARKCTEAN